MAIADLSQEGMQAARAELQQALYNHEQWCEALYATLICSLPPDERDIDKEAHRHCRFGQWLYGPGPASIRGHPGLEQIETEHRRVHEYAASLLLASRQRAPASVQSYERFLTALKRMRLEIFTILRELDDALQNLDPLTGAASRTGLLTKLREQQELVKRKIQSCCLAMMDIDRFKAVNDAYGHVAGDRVLVAAARLVMKQIRPYDKLFRYGGEEFLICLANANIDTAREVVERLREALVAMPIEGEGHPPIHVTASFGLAPLDPDIPVEESIDRADKAAYAAKLGGRNRTVVWDPSLA
jgi:diguanylate cyclase (GGDEF)-like protein